ncbi:uncharacterized protein JCM10292_001859 [Rhodotorula paludigena]|uniref:uncharacterized protein n=1 Tax=Rhodotorula paludigena TaxID=86838 RepID=UPI0031817ED9
MSSPAAARSPAAPLVAPHLCPVVHAFTTPDLAASLARNRFASFADLVHPFVEHPGLDRVTVRLPSTYDSLALDRWPLRVVDRPLPPAFSSDPAASRPAGGAGAPAPNALLSPAAPTLPGTPSTPYHHPSHAERDELFLDQVGALVAAKVDEWVAQPGRDELDVRPLALRPRPGADDGDSASAGAAGAQGEVDEGWQGRAVEKLAPWFKEVRDEVFRRRDMVECDTLAWPIGCVLALSTSHPDPLNALSALWELTSPAALFAPASYPPRSGAEEDGRHEWANPDVLRFVVLVHDFGAGTGRQGWDDAQRLHETIRKTYGNHTALLPLFSAAPSSTDPQPPARGASDLWASLPVPTQPRPGAGTLFDSSQQGGVIGLGVDDSDLDPFTAAPAPATPPSPPLPQRGADLSETDLQSLRAFARELVVQSLVPFVERQAVVLHEQWQSSKRGLGGRLFSVGRKYFGGGGTPAQSASAATSAAGSRAGSPAPGAAGKEGYNAGKGYYHYLAPASQTRRLADLAFFLGDYKLALTVYESCAKDFRADKAWRHHAAAVRMAGLCQLLVLPRGASFAPHSPASPEAYLVQALAPSPPGGTAGGSVADFDALKATLLYYECYRALDQWALAPPALVRAAAEADEVVSAVLLEQAAIADLHAPVGVVGASSRGRRRKYAFHMAMAAARYEKCGVKALSRRCLSQASTLYRPLASLSPADPSAPPPLTSLLDPRLPPSPSAPLAPWLAIRSHLHHSLARQAYTVGAAHDAVAHFLELLVGSSASAAPSSSAGAGAGAGVGAGDWLDDFALAWDLLGSPASAAASSDPHANAHAHRLELPVQLFDSQGARIRVGSVSAAGASAAAAAAAAADGGDAAWKGLEDEMLRLAEWDAQKKPRALVYRGAKGGAGAGQQQDEGEVEAVLGETFHLEVPVTNPLEAFLAIGGLQVEAEADEDVSGSLEISPPQEVELAPLEASKIYVPIRAAALGSFTFRSLSYRFSDLLPVTESLTARYSKPTPAQPNKPSVRRTLPLKVRVRAPVPVLSVALDELQPKLFHGETQLVNLKLTNAGQVPLADLHGAVSHPSFVHLDPPSDSVPSTSSHVVPNHLAPPDPSRLLDTDRVLGPGESLTIQLLYRADRVGLHHLLFLFAFRAAMSTGGETAAPEYFTTRAVHALEVYPSLEVRYAVRPQAREGAPFALGVELYNSGLPADDVSISSVSLVSPLWQASPTSGSVDLLADQPPGWQQGSTFFLPVNAVPADVKGKGREDVDEWTVRQVNTLLDGKEVGKALPADVALTISSGASAASGPIISNVLHALVTSYSELRRAALRSRYPTVAAGLHPHLFPLFSSRSAFLAISFTSPSLSIPSSAEQSAHLLVPLDSPALGAATGSAIAASILSVLTAAERKAGGLYEESQRERTALLSALRRSELVGSEAEVPAVIGIEVDELVQHDFSQSGPLTLPIRFAIRNLSATATFSYHLSLASPSTRGVTLAGALTHKGEVCPLALASVQARLWIPRAGVFQAGAYTLTLSWTKGATGTVQKVVLQGAAREIRVREAGRASAPSAPPPALAPPVPLVDTLA